MVFGGLNGFFGGFEWFFDVSLGVWMVVAFGG